ncbi:D-aminoacylase [candidate division KSB1 bacterium]|nr:D-aminoacylase [candidate division KSB1 bacterium]
MNQFAACLILFILLLSSSSFSQFQFDLLIQNGRIIDGSGNPWFRGDVGIRDGRIAAIGKLAASDAQRVIAAEGLAVAPGFIDVHTHVEDGIRKRPTAENFLFDGVTTIITGNCGGSETDLPKLFDELRATGISLNVATLIGHNSVRRAVMNTAKRDPTPTELAKMSALVERAMQAGAVGFSTGLIYIPGTYSKTPEVVALAKAAAEHGGVYASHIRNEGDSVLFAIREAIHIGREANIPVEISHFKISSKRLWDHSDETIALVEQARAEGLDVCVDQYPYTASSTNLGVLLPSWALADGDSAIKARLHNPMTRKQIAQEMKHFIRERAGRNRLDYAIVARCRWDSTMEGKSIAEINQRMRRKANLDNEIQTVLDMMLKGGAAMIYHSMFEDDVVRIMQYPNAMIASDAGVAEFGRGSPHPRAYGTNARVLGRYVREKKILRLEEAIRKMTSLPAQRFRLHERGLLRAGMAADIVVFDAQRVKDRATFEKPHAYAEGFRYVLVNGEVVIEEGKHTGARAGEILFGPGKRE